MCPTQTPCLLKSSHQVHQLRVVPQLWVNNFNILSVPLHKQIFQVVIATLDVQAELPDSLALACTHLSARLLSNDQHRDVQIVTPLSNAIGNLVDFADLAEELIPQTVILLVCLGIENASTQALFTLVATHLLN